MDLPLIKYHMQELNNLIKQEPNNITFAHVFIEIETVLDSLPLKDVEAYSPKENT